MYFTVAICITQLIRTYSIQLIKYLFNFYENVMIHLFNIMLTKEGKGPERESTISMRYCYKDLWLRVVPYTCG